VLFLEGVGDVLEEDKPQHDVFVLGGVHLAAQGVGHLPKLCFVADGSAGDIRSAQVILSLRHFLHYLIISSERNAIRRNETQED
jgi:hypothetical protein